MAWRGDRYNQLQNDTQTAAGSWATGAEAFDAAWDNCGTFIKNAIRGTEFGDNGTPPSPESHFKVYVDTRTGRPVGVRLRYSFPTGTPPNNPEGDHLANDISWTIRLE